MAGLINRVFVILLMMSAAAGMALSIAALFIPELPGFPDDLGRMEEMPHLSGLSISGGGAISPPDSPHAVNITIRTPPLEEADLLFLEIYAGDKHLGYVDCLEGADSTLDYPGLTEIGCPAYLPYDYEPGTKYSVFAVLTRQGKEYSSGPALFDADWQSYEEAFRGVSSLMAISIAIAYIFILLPVALIVFSTAMRTRHRTLETDEYSIRSMLSPLTFGRTMLQKFHALLLSPYFWALEAAGIMVILLYMAIASSMWKSDTAFIAFIFSGLMALIIPLLWIAAWWYADYREREPLRVIFTLFLWGMLSALMAIGLNTVAGALLALLGIGFVGSFLVAPLAEESYKGAGLSLLSEHHEFDSVEDGIVFGFTIGMGFSFIENWIYFIGNPMGSDIAGWFVLFLMRSIFFSANHGLYTAISGALMGYFIERKFSAPALSLLIAIPLAALFHAMHNSGEMLITVLGAGGLLIYCCFLIPLFDYGGFILLMLLFIRSVIRKKAE